MTIRGTVRNGTVVLEGSTKLPEGAMVQVRVVDEKDVDALWKGLLQFAGKAKGLPPDMARNHDHYLHGTPKR